jgi:pimeloyl-ACP methyl ester carboxylesterase
MGGMPDERRADYDLASPLALLPLGVRQLVVWGTEDRPDLVDENRRYCPAAQESGDAVVPLELPGADHFTVIDPATLTWLAVRQRLAELSPPASLSSQSEEGVPGVQTILAAAPPTG